MKRSRIKNSLAPLPEMSESVSALAGEMADDFKNILTVILGACTLIDMDTAADSELLKCVTLIRASAEHAAALSDRMAQISRLASDGGQQKVGEDKIALKSSVSSSVVKRGKLLS